MISIDNVLVRSEIADTPFICDVKKCKGACCTFESKYGAPLRRAEIGKIDSIVNIVKNYLPIKNITEIEEYGFYEEIDGELLIRSIDNKECVFVYYEDGIARCGIEKAFIDEKTNFKKPISCHLFPIRLTDFGGNILKFEKIDECNPAIEKGTTENITVAEFCEEPLERYFGKTWYSELKKAIGK
ncbi:MAG: hypothetical protein A2W30_09290 [Ignavibacteria bacterium RBG_16_36_9]|nr:MAG: hypothetical protein A2W30_09290 [Ignavibacteria bacterium RBG_16_36_9]